MNGQEPQGHWFGSGVHQEVTPARQESMAEALEKAEAYAVKSQTHLWLLMVTYKAPDGFLDVQDGLATPGDAGTILDADVMMGTPALVCYLCEQPYHRSLRFRRCPGEPR